MICTEFGGKLRALLALASFLFLLLAVASCTGSTWSNEQQQQNMGISQSSASSAELLQQEHNHHAHKKNSRKGMAGWVQTYKEPAEQMMKAGRRAVTERDADEGGAEGPREEESEQPTCTIKVQKVEKYTGKCVRLRGGAAACQTDTYLDPVNEDCMFLS